MTYSALLIGCGNIGALYDLNDPAKVWTHAKAFSKIKNINFVVADADHDLASKIAKKYKTSVVELSAIKNFKAFDIVSITTPTPSHFKYLKRVLEDNVPLVVCEKPVAADIKELNKLIDLYKKSKSKVVVNYIRRFQPAYLKLKSQLSKQKVIDVCKGINLKYQRGFLNNGGHAFDLLEFLFDKPFSFEGFTKQSSFYDAFVYDPTVTGACTFEGIPVTILGVADAKYPVFEIELFFNDGKIVICHSGDEIRYYKITGNKKSLAENNSLRQVNILSKYMLPVMDRAMKIFGNSNEPDNFLQAIELNKRIVSILSKPEKKHS